MDKEKIVRKVIAKLSSKVSPRDLNQLILTLSKSKDADFIYNVLYRFIKRNKISEQEQKQIFERLIKTEKIHEISKDHNNAFKQLLDGEFSYVNLTV